MSKALVKVENLKGHALGWAVAAANGVIEEHILYNHRVPGRGTLSGIWVGQSLAVKWTPWRVWDQGGPIITRHRISLQSPMSIGKVWMACIPVNIEGRCVQEYAQEGGTPLEAAMRCFVTLQRGYVMNVPEEVL